ncbi:hypothetical protein DEO72_LG3g1379 [Vigna unguiculata]|uniref:Uncharacterized protein n=1 Tax=Vigna unguiculata TaxID=3917 RepID=A0A4D6LE22_VIGUN|nr:hypothetical protein DEO72_LG3g1379 [Vigna unguiculata]
MTAGRSSFSSDVLLPWCCANSGEMQMRVKLLGFPLPWICVCGVVQRFLVSRMLQARWDGDALFWYGYARVNGGGSGGSQMQIYNEGGVVMVFAEGWSEVD